MKRKQQFLLIGLVTLLLLFGVWLALQNRAFPSATARIGYLNITASLPLFIAEENRYFEDEGVLIQTHQIGSSNLLVDGILADNLDLFVEASAAPALAAELQSPGQQKIFAVSSITQETPFDAILVPPTSSLETLDDLANQTIGVFPGSTATNLLRKFLADKGVDISNMVFLPIPPQNHLTALLEGSIDALHTYEPTIAIGLSAGSVRQFYGSVYAQMLEQNPQGVAVIGTNFVAEHPETAQSVIRALERAMAFMRENDSEARRILARRMNLTDSVADRTVLLYMLPHNEVDVSIVQRYSDMLTDLGELSGGLDVAPLIYR